MSYDQDRAKRRMTSRDGDYVDTSKPSAFFQPKGGRDWTVSIAVPGSVLSTCRRDDQRTAVINQIARSLAVFSVDEVVIFDDSPMDKRVKNVDPNSYMGDIDPCGYIEHLLNYVEVPPFMRRALVPFHANLKQAGLLESLDVPHHPNPSDYLPYCEGVTTSEGAPGGKGTVVDVGSKEGKVTIKDDIPPNTRVTLKFDDNDPNHAEPCHPDAPRTEGGFYWGYSIRRCKSLAAVFEECAYDGGYDLSIGTSERGRPIFDAFPQIKKKESLKFNHLIVVFGGPRGLEYAAENDPALQEMGIIRGKTKELFDNWINILPGQGSRTIRTSEALFIGLTGLRPLWEGR
ncbi:putative RNA methyltransferase [Truncatella angustata]|uniref:RNA methyltransferase n=1 Tax=Truncatella angustata TaxID=152316 RepID=A0A9P8RK25_9PEZI|nr:putative RNA methyltransferase [Truncatella angustata]KAH6643369.1 putative RNA methyltransferase [Truncatella angustata]